jgi:sigma-B regulation protein RsbU (phosphoserine phosphatase)
LDAPGGQELSLTVPADGRYLAMIRAVVAEAAAAGGFDEQFGREAVLGLCEAISNVIRHCYRGNCGPVTIRCLLGADRMELRLRDYGPKPDPACLRGRELDQVRPGGLGLHIIRQTMDEVEFDLSPPEGTELRMVKYRPGCGPRRKDPG